MPLINRIRSFAIGLTLSFSYAVVKADVVAVVSAKSPITALGASLVEDIFFGKAKLFPNGMQAEPIDQAEDSAARNEFYEKLAGKSPAQVKAYWSKIIFTGRGQPPPSVSSIIEMKNRISKNPAAIGYINSADIDASVKIVLVLK